MRQHWLIYLLAIVIAVCGLMACCTGCERSHLGNAGLPQAVTPQAPVPVNLPQPATLQLTTSAAAAGVINGADFDTEACLPCNVSEQGDAAHFTPAWDPAGEPTPGGLAFALYWIEQLGFSGPQRITLEWSDAPTDGMLWLACANWQKNAWEWTSLGVTETFVVDCDEGYMDIDGRLALVVLLIGTADATLTRLRYLGVPIATLSVTPDKGAAPLEVNLDGLYSWSPNGDVIQFEWDFDGDGIYDDDTGAAGYTSYLYSEPRGYQCTLRITDELGAQATDSRLITATGYYDVVVDDGGQGLNEVGKYTSLRLINGRPAISYYDATAQDLKYVRAQDGYGIAWEAPQVLDSAGDVGRYTSLAFTNGHPVVAYCAGDGEGLKYIQAKDADGDAWWGPITVDGSVGAGVDASLAIVDDHPAIAFYNSNISTLCFVRSTDADGTGWYATQAVDDSGYAGEECSLAVINGKPAIAYYDASGKQILYVSATDAAGTAWGTPSTVQTGCVGVDISLCQVIDRPGICYYTSGGGLSYIGSVMEDPDVSGWGTPVPIDAEPYAGIYCSLCFINEYPRVSYMGDSMFGLWYAKAKWGGGSEWYDRILIDNPDLLTGHYTSLSDIHDCAGISYATGDYQLKYALIVD